MKILSFNKLLLIIFFSILFLSCTENPKEYDAISEYARTKDKAVLDIDFDLLESKFIKDITALDSANYYKNKLYNNKGINIYEALLDLYQSKDSLAREYRIQAEDNTSKMEKAKSVEIINIHHKYVISSLKNELKLSKELIKDKEKIQQYELISNAYNKFVALPQDSIMLKLYYAKYNVLNLKLNVLQTVADTLKLSPNLSKVINYVE
jgi:hypothetical protein